MSNKEEWRDVPGYEGYYQVSDMGRVRSLDRVVKSKKGSKRNVKSLIFKAGSGGGLYNKVTLRKDGMAKTMFIHRMVATSFLGHEPCGMERVVDHIDGDKTNNKKSNLRVVSVRENSTICHRNYKVEPSSKYIGVSWSKSNCKWQSSIEFNGATIGLGHHVLELDASIAYQSALSEIKDGSFNPDDYKPKWTSEHKGVSFKSRTDRWEAHIRLHGKHYHLGSYRSEHAAIKARITAEVEVAGGGCSC